MGTGMGVLGGDGEGGGFGSEGWRSKVRVEPAAPAAKVAPLPKPDPPPPQPPPERRRMLLHPRDIVPNSVSSRLKLSRSQYRRAYSTLLLSAARIALTSSTLHATSTASFPRRTGERDGRGAGRALLAHEKSELSAHEETRWRTVRRDSGARI